MMTVDQREPDAVLDQIIACPEWAHIPVSTGRLPHGDFEFSYKVKNEWVPRVVFESKTWGDLVNSIKDGRLADQLTAGRAQYQMAGLIVKGKFEVNHLLPNPLDEQPVFGRGRGSHIANWTRKELEGLLLSLQDSGIPVVRVEEPDTLPYYLRWLHDHYAKLKDDPDPFKRALSVVPTVMLDAIPGIGPKTARRLVDELCDKPGSLAGVVQADVELLFSITGNMKLANEIYGRFH